MGGGKTTTKENSTQQQTVQLPAWMTQGGEDLYKRANATAMANPIQAYTGQLSPQMAANQVAASQAAAAGRGTGQQQIAQGAQMTQAAAMGQTPRVRTWQQNAQGYAPAQQTFAPSVHADQVTSQNFDGNAAQQYMSPYTTAVQQNTLQEMQRQNQMENAQLGDSAQAAKAYGGARHGVLEAETRKGQNINMRDYIDRSNADAFANAQQQFGADRAANMQAQQSNQGANLQAGTTNASLMDVLLGRNMDASNQSSQFNAAARNEMANANANRGLQADSTNAGHQQSMLDRMLAAGGQMANIGAQSQDLQSQQIRDLASTGAVEQATQGDALTAAYNEFLRMQDAPMDRYRDLMGILSGAPRNVTTNGTSSGTSVTKQSGGLLNSLLGLGQMGLSLASDRRLKTDVLFSHELDNGLGVYKYRYIWDAPDAPMHVGVMADEVEKIMPWALGPLRDGFKTVDYSKIGGLN